MRRGSNGLLIILSSCDSFPLQSQYRFVYDVLEEFLLCGYSFFPVSELSQRLKHKSMKGPGNKSEYQIEFEVRLSSS